LTGREKKVLNGEAKVKRCEGSVLKRIPAEAGECHKEWVKQLRHPCLASYEVSGEYFQITPWGDQRTPENDERSLKTAMVCIIAGVKALHDSGFAHHDLRWPNVLGRLDAGHEKQYFVTDFEAAQPLTPELRKDDFTGLGRMLLRPYAATVAASEWLSQLTLALFLCPDAAIAQACEATEELGLTDVAVFS
jgi:hypothetical protein